jgi:hypothetical protein
VNRGELRQELYDLGHDYLEDEPGRAERFLDQGAADILLDEPWPQRVTEDTLAPGALLPSLGTILQVWDASTGRVLFPTTAQEVRDAYTAADTSQGEPIEYYVVQNRMLRTRPLVPEGRQITVEHFSKGVWQDGATRCLKAPADTAVLVGEEIFDEAVLLAARLRALEDTDEDDLRESISARLERELVGLRDRELNPVADEPKRIKQTRPWH